MRKNLQTRSLVAAWFDFLAPGEQPLAQQLHRQLKALAPELEDMVRQGNLMLSINGEPVLALAPTRGQVQLLIYNGADIEAQVGPLEGAARRQRVLKLRSSQPLDEGLVARVAGASIAHCRRSQAQTAERE